MSLLCRHSTCCRAVASASLRNPPLFQSCLSQASSQCLSTSRSPLKTSRPRSYADKRHISQFRSYSAASGLKGLRSRSSPNAAASHEAAPRTILGQGDHLPIRARFAPSPTGFLHLGSLRTALFNRLSASASKGGALVLRIEDTDQNRLVEGAEESLLQDLAWAGLSWDEGPDKGGPYGPYRQSERLPIYKEHAQLLIDKGLAYRCFCSPSLLESQKRALHDAGKPTFYPGTCRPLPADESLRRAHDLGEPHVVRLRANLFGRPRLRDAIYGPFQKKDIEEDFILLKADGFPTYHFANVVDDHLMRITHVIRGEEWLISTPKHVALYEAFGWQPPVFAHLGLLVNPDGTKLSKRTAGATLTAYKEEGVFPMALLSWLATLGSSLRAETTTPRTVEDLARALTFKFTRGGIKLNTAKLDHFNAKYRDAILKHPIPALAAHETTLLSRHFTQPLLRLIHARTQTSSNLVPALADPSAQATAEAYISRITAPKHGGLRDAKLLLDQHPFLFWRPSKSLYASSLRHGTFQPDPRVLDALAAALAREADIWQPSQEGTCPAVMGAIHAALEDDGDGIVEQVELHNTLRFVAAGASDVASPSSALMFGMLGRVEWQHRLDTVRHVLAEEVFGSIE